MGNEKNLCFYGEWAEIHEDFTKEEAEQYLDLWKRVQCRKFGVKKPDEEQVVYQPEWRINEYITKRASLGIKIGIEINNL